MFPSFSGLVPCPVLSWGSIFLSDWPGPRLAPPCSALGSSRASAWRPLCPWDGCLLDWRHGECCGGGRGLGRVLGCRCRSWAGSVPTWHYVEERGVRVLPEVVGVVFSRLLFQSGVRLMASLWISLGSLWVTPQLSVARAAADGRCWCIVLSQGRCFILCPRPPGSASPAPVGVQPFLYVYLPSHLWPVWPPSPGSMPSVVPSPWALCGV